jgi:hypothetical protein
MAIGCASTLQKGGSCAAARLETSHRNQAGHPASRRNVSATLHRGEVCSITLQAVVSTANSISPIYS